MTDNRLQKSLEEEFINNDPLYNFGGWVPPVIFGGVVSPTPTPSITPTLTPTITPTLTPSITPTITPTPSPAGYDPDYDAILTYATGQGYTLPTDIQKTLQNQLVVDLKSYGIWTDLDIFYVFATDGDEKFSLINWKNPNAFEATKSSISSPVFTTNQGWDQNGSSNYLITGFITSVNGTGYTLNDAARIYYDYDNDTTTTQVGYSGNIVQGGVQPDRWNGTNVSSHSVNSTNLLSSAFDNTGIGLKMIQRTSSTIVNLYNNSATPNARTQTSVALDTNTHTILRYGSGAGNYSSNICSMYGLGASMSGKETDLYNAINTYMASI